MLVQLGHNRHTCVYISVVCVSVEDTTRTEGSFPGRPGSALYRNVFSIMRYDYVRKPPVAGTRVNKNKRGSQTGKMLDLIVYFKCPSFVAWEHALEEDNV